MSTQKLDFGRQKNQTWMSNYYLCWLLHLLVIFSSNNSHLTTWINTKIIYDDFNYLNYSQIRYTLNSRSYWTESGSKCKHLYSMFHTCFIYFRSIEGGGHSIRRSVSDSVLADNASPVNACIIVQKNKIRTHGWKNWMNPARMTFFFSLESQYPKNRRSVRLPTIILPQVIKPPLYEGIRGYCYLDTEFQRASRLVTIGNLLVGWIGTHR